jgi:hypothetical protein
MEKRGLQHKGKIKKEFAPDLTISPDGVLQSRRLMHAFERGSIKYDPVRSPIHMLGLILEDFNYALQVLEGENLSFFSYRNSFGDEKSDGTILVFVKTDDLWNDLAAFLKALDKRAYKQFLRIHAKHVVFGKPPKVPRVHRRRGGRKHKRRQKHGSKTWVEKTYASVTKE